MKGTRRGSIFLLAKIVKHRFKATKGDFLYCGSAMTPEVVVVLVARKMRVARKIAATNTMYVWILLELSISSTPVNFTKK